MPSYIIKMNVPPIQIFFARSKTAPTVDDILRIVPSNISGRFYDMSYTDNHSVVKAKYTATESEIFDYLDSMFALMLHDEDPFVQVQLQTPAFPAILLNVKSLCSPSVKDAFYVVVRNTLRNWPTAVMHPSRSPRAAVVAAAAAAAPVTQPVTEEEQTETEVEDAEESEDEDEDEEEDEIVVENNTNSNINSNYNSLFPGPTAYNGFNIIPNTYANWTSTYAPQN
jgi:hypothetical protein